MTVKQIEQRLAELRSAGKITDHTTVFLRQTNDEYPNSLVQQAGVRTIYFDPEDGEPPIGEECLVITDDI